MEIVLVYKFVFVLKIVAPKGLQTYNIQQKSRKAHITVAPGSSRQLVTKLRTCFNFKTKVKGRHEEANKGE